MSTYYVTTVGAKLPDLIDTLNTLGGNLITPVKGKKDTFILSGPPITATVIEDLQEQELIHYSRLEDPVTVTE